MKSFKSTKAISLKIICVCIFLNFILVSCAPNGGGTSHTETFPVRTQMPPTESPFAETQTSPNESPTPIETPIPEETSTPIKTPTPAEKLSVYEDYWFNQLSEREKGLYNTILQKIMAHEDYYVSTKVFSRDEIMKVRTALEKERPELNLYVFSEDDYDAENDSQGENIYGVKYWYRDIVRLNEHKPYDFSKIQKEIDSINAKCDDIISRMPENISVYEKYEYLALQLADMADYYWDDQATDVSFIYLSGPFLQQRAICNSYTSAYQYLCKRANLWCIFIYDAVQAHAYNMIKLDTGFYYVDITWCDQEDGSFDYSYFALTQEQVLKDHTPEEEAPQGASIPVSKQ